MILSAKVINIDEMSAQVCWLGNQRYEVGNYVEGIRLEWLPEEAKTSHEASRRLRGFLAICELYDEEKLKLIEVRKIAWQTTIFTGILALDQMAEVMKLSDSPLAIHFIGYPKTVSYICAD
jgi:hypothetical protein